MTQKLILLNKFALFVFFSFVIIKTSSTNHVIGRRRLLPNDLSKDVSESTKDENFKRHRSYDSEKFYIDDNSFNQLQNSGNNFNQIPDIQNNKLLRTLFSNNNDSRIITIFDDKMPSRMKRNINYHRNNFRRTSCGVSFCTFVQYYPYDEINDVINQVIKILISRDPIIRRKKYLIDQKVLDYHPKSLNHHNILNSQAFNKSGCTVHVNITHPQEGLSIDDKNIYYIVNIPSFQQPIEKIMCNSGGVCNNEIEAPFSICRQVYRNEELLVVPTNKQYFDINDLKIKSFQIPNGCMCFGSNSNA